MHRVQNPQDRRRRTHPEFQESSHCLETAWWAWIFIKRGSCDWQPRFHKKYFWNGAVTYAIKRSA